MAQQTAPLDVQGPALTKSTKPGPAGEPDAIDQTANIVYTGSTYGLLQANQASRGEKILSEIAVKRGPGAVVLGLGDNFAIDTTMATKIDRSDPKPDTDPAVQFFQRGHYDALVPGAQDFFFGAEFLRRAAAALPLVAANLTVSVTATDPCKAAPTAAAAAWILPNQVSTSLSGGKGGKGGGSSGGGGGGSGANCRPGGQKPPKRDAGERPALAWPDAGNIYPWTTAFSISNAPKGEADKKDDPVLVTLCWQKPSSKPGDPTFASNTDEAVYESYSNCTKVKRKDKTNTIFTLDANAAPILWSDFLADTLEPSELRLPSSVGAPAKQTGELRTGPPTLPSPHAEAKLFPGVTVGLCMQTLVLDALGKIVEPEIDAKPAACIPLTVKQPLGPWPWVRVERKTGPAGKATRYVIFGAMAPDTLKGVADTNLQWRENERHEQAAASVGDPGSAVLQAISAYNLLQTASNLHSRTGDGCGNQSFGVLLAQMTPGEAKTLAAYLSSHGKAAPAAQKASDCQSEAHVDVILSAADEYDSSQEMTITVHPSEAGYIPVITPRPLMVHAPSAAGAAAAFQLQAPLEELAIVRTRTVEPAGVVTRYHNQPDADDRLLEGTCEQENLEKDLNLPPTMTGKPFAIGSFSAGAWKPPQFCSAKSEFECAVLGEMQEQFHADLALVEEKSFYAGCTYNPGRPATPQQTLWASGHLTRVALLGSTLNTILQASQKTASKSSLENSALESGQVLAMLGIAKDPSSGLYLVNGIELNPSATYTVATSDVLTGANSDYPQMGQTDLLKPEVFWGRALDPNNALLAPVTEEIADMGDRAVYDMQWIVDHPTDKHGKLAKQEKLAAAELVAPSSATAPLSPCTPVARDPKPVAQSQSQITPCREVLAEKEDRLMAVTQMNWPVATPAKQSQQPAFTYSNREHPPLPPTKAKPSPPDAEISAFNPEYRPFMSVVLQQLSGAYSLSRPNQGDTSINTNLSGVTNPNVASPYSDSISVADNLRVNCYLNASWTAVTRPPCGSWKVEKYFQWLPWIQFENFGMDEQVSFVRNRQGSLNYQAAETTKGAPVPEKLISYSGNSVTVSPFLEFQVKKWAKWKAVELRPLLFTSNLATLPEILATKGKDPANGASIDYEFSVGRTRSWAPVSVGTRWEKNDLNYAEVGFTDQISKNVLSGLILNGALIELKASNTAASVAKTITPVAGDVAIPSYSTYHQKGAYWLGMLTWGVPKIRTTYQATGFGNFFAYGRASDSSVLTRYAAQMTHTLQFPLWPDLSIGPSYNVFFFQDSQTHAMGTSLIRQTVSFQLNYNFSWHQGLPVEALVGKPN